MRLHLAIVLPGRRFGQILLNRIVHDGLSRPNRVVRVVKVLLVDVLTLISCN